MCVYTNAIYLYMCIYVCVYKYYILIHTLNIYINYTKENKTYHIHKTYAK